MRISIAFTVLMVSLSSVVRADDATDPLAQAQKAYTAGNFAEARSLAKSVIANPGTTDKDARLARAWRMVGTSSCSLKDKVGAIEAVKHLDRDTKQLVAYVCKHNGIDI
jgi:hypothetical protein